MTGTYEIAAPLGGLRRRELRSFLLASSVVPLGLLVVFVYTPSSKISVPLGVVSVELVAATTLEKAAPPAPKPAPPVDDDDW